MGRQAWGHPGPHGVPHRGSPGPRALEADRDRPRRSQRRSQQARARSGAGGYGRGVRARPDRPQGPGPGPGGGDERSAQHQRDRSPGLAHGRKEDRDAAGGGERHPQRHLPLVSGRGAAARRGRAVREDHEQSGQQRGGHARRAEDAAAERKGYFFAAGARKRRRCPARCGRDAAQVGGRAQGDGRAADREGRLLARRIPRASQAVRTGSTMPPRKRLGQLLTELGVIDEHQLQSALGHQKQWGGKLGGILVQKGFCSEETVVSALAKHLGMQSVRLADVKIDPRAVKCVSKQVAEKLHVFPYELSGSGRSEVVTIAMSDPADRPAVDQLASHTGKRIKPMLAGDGDVVAAIQAHYGGGEEKKEPTDKVARPAPAGLPTVTPGAPSGSVAGFPRRIEPPASAPGAARARAAPYIPPPIPAAEPAAPAPKLAESEARASAAPPAPAPPAAAPAQPPDGDGQEFGLEPIAAHSHFGDAVVGQEDVAGEGFAGDPLEAAAGMADREEPPAVQDRKSTRLNSSHDQ